PKPRPTHISAGVSGNGLAGRDLLASRQHRKMVASHIAASLPGTHECPVAASKLAGRPGVFVDETVDEVKYFHLMLDRQAIRFAEDALTENLGLDQKARETIPPESREEETLPLFPAMADQDIPMTRTRPIPGSPQQKRLVAELAAAAQHPARARNAAHAKNNPMSSPDGKQDTRQATPPCPESRPQHGGDEFARSNQGTPPTDDGPHHPTGNCGPASDRFRHLRKPGPSRPAYPSDERHAEKYTNRHILFLANPACVSPHRHRTPCGRKPDTLALNTKASFRCTASDLRVQSVRKDVPGPSSANTKQP
ncbi:Hint domain-containing protein, partial [Rhodovulum imhoffii]